MVFSNIARNIYIYIYTRTKKHLKNEQRSRDGMLLQKIANTSGVGISNIMRKYIPTPLPLTLFFCSSIPTPLFILNVFSFLFVIFVQYSKHCSRTFEIVQKSRSCRHGDIIV